jgi:hypothetical protein
MVEVRVRMGLDRFIGRRIPSCEGIAAPPLYGAARRPSGVM